MKYYIVTNMIDTRWERSYIIRSTNVNIKAWFLFDISSNQLLTLEQSAFSPNDYIMDSKWIIKEITEEETFLQIL